MLDGIVMEKLGIPTAVVATEPFISSGKAMAVSHGMPDYPFAVIPHPIAATETSTLHSWADQVVDQIASIWLKGLTTKLEASSSAGRQVDSISAFADAMALRDI